MAQNPFDKYDAPASDANPFDKYDDGAKKPGGIASDLGKSIKAGVQDIPGIATGLADLPFALTAGARPFTKAADALGDATGFQPGKWAKETKYSDGYNQGKANIDKAWESGSAGDIALEYLKNPGYTANQVAQSLPGMVVGGVASKGALALGRSAAVAGDVAAGVAAKQAVPGILQRTVGEKLAVPVAAGLGEGAITAGQQMSQYEGDDQQKNALASLGAGATTAVIGVGAGRLANELGLETAETAMAKIGTKATGAADEVPMSLKRRVLSGMVSEAVLQEMPQSALEQMWQNWSKGNDLTQGVARAATEGGLAGAVMGAAANVRGPSAERGPVPGEDQAAPPGQTPIPGEPLALAAPANNDPIVVAPNGVARTSSYQRPPFAGRDDYTDVTPIVRRPSEEMGIDPSAGPLSAGAALAVDTGAYMPPAQEQSPAPEADPVVLQNRDRTSAASIAQMQEIAANPDYLRVGPSRDMTSGAPIVFGEMPKSALLGRAETVVDGKGERMATQYAVVDAGDLIASNNADGTTEKRYVSGSPGKLRSVAGNGRTAGLQAAYKMGTAEKYRQELTNDAAALGLDPQGIAGMKRPVLVRVMQSGDVTQDMGDRTNITATQKLSPLEQAGNDARRLDVRNLSFDDAGNPTADSLKGFVSAMPVSERGDMLNPDGTPTRQAVDRLMAATFKQAYESDELVQLYAQATDPDARAVMAAAADASGVLANLKGAGEFDVRGAVAEAAKMAVNASRQGLKLSDVMQNADLDMSPDAYPVAAYLAQNIRTPKKMAEGLRRWGQLALEQANIAEENKTQGSLLGPRPTLSREEVFARLGSEDNPANQAVGKTQEQTNGSPSAPTATGLPGMGEAEADVASGSAGDTGSVPVDAGRPDDAAASAPVASDAQPGAVRAGGREDGNAALSAPISDVRAALANIRKRKAQEKADAEKQANQSSALTNQAQLAIEKVAPNGAGAPIDIRTIVAKQIPEMTDGELAAAVSHYGPNHKRTAKLEKEQAKRAAVSQPQGVSSEPQADQAQQADAQPASAGSTPAGATQSGNSFEVAAPSPGADVAPELALTAPSRDDVLAQQDRAEQSDKTDQQEQVRRESEIGDNTFMTGFSEDGRQDNTGSLLDAPTQEEPKAQKKEPVTSLYSGAPDAKNSGAMESLEGFKPGDLVNVPGRTIGTSTVEIVFRRAMPGFGAEPMARILGGDGKKLDVLLSELTHAEIQPAKKPVAKKKPSPAEVRAKADLMSALADLGDILGKSAKLNMMPPEQVQKLMPVLTRVIDAAFRLGYAKFKDAAKFALDQIRENIGTEAADAITLDHLQGAYIGMAGGKDSADTKRAVIDVETKAEIERHTAQQEQEPQADKPAAEDVKADPAAAADSMVQAKANGQTLSAALSAEIQAGRMPKDNPALKRLVEAYDGNEASPSRMKEGQESLEAAIVARTREIIDENRGNGREATFKALRKLYESQPNLNIRTSTSIANQAYSTPAPLAYLGSELAGIKPGMRVLEPTGGTGMLLAGASIDSAVVNELNPSRVALLKEQGFKVTNKDATDAGLFDKVAPVDAVITNPPFGSVKDDAGKAIKADVDGYAIGQIDHLIAARALEKMKDDGSAVLILGANKVAGGLSTDDRIFFNWLYGNYNVTGHFEVEGDLYARQGAGWPVRVIAINGRQKSNTFSPVAGTIQRAQNWDQVYDHFNEALDTSGQPFRGTGAGSVSASPIEASPRGLPGTTPAKAAKPNRPATPKAGGISAGNVAGASPGVVDVVAKPAKSNVAPGADEQRLNAQPDQSDRLEPKRPGGDAGAGRPAKSAGADALSTEGNQFQSPYVARSSRKDAGVLIPANMAQPTQDALSRLEDEVGDIDEFARSELGYKTTDDLHAALMGLQVDSVATAIYQIKQNKGVVIADQTGIGKGRQAAAIIRWAHKQGYTPVFVSVKPSLFTDMYGDLADIGTTDINPFILNGSEWIAGADGTKLFSNKAATHKKTIQRIASSGQLPEGSNALFMTYSQINVQNTQREALTALAPNAVFVLDESHNAAGESATGEFVVSVLGAAKGVTYLSATYAKRPDNMPLYFKTDIGDAAADSEGLALAMAAGGLPLQTVVSNNLVKAGQMFRRERSYDGVSIESKFDTANRALHESLSDKATQALRGIVVADGMFHSIFVKQMSKELKKQGSAVQDNAGNQASAGVQHTEFSSVVHNFVKQMLLGLKAQTAANEAIESLKRGEKPIIAVENTMGSFLAEYAASNNIAQGDALGSFDYRTVLSRALQRTRTITVVLPNGQKTKRDIPLSELDPLTRTAYAKAQEVIDGLKLDIPVSPIDWIRSEITKAGHSVAEITGRNLSVDYTNPKKAVLSAIDQLEQSDKVNTTRLFNGGQLDALILNVAGSTGISLHASEKFADQRQRHMIVAQAAGDINIFMQMLGRIHRTGQVKLPKYSILSVDLPTEKRPTAVLSVKMKSLNANTSSNTESATSVKSADILNKYGDQVVNQYLQENLDLAMKMGVQDLIGENAEDDLARKVTGRLALQPVETQLAFYDDVEGAYNTLIDFLNKTNQNDLEPRTFDYDAKAVREEVLFEGRNKATPFGEDAIYSEYSIKAQGIAMKPEEITDAVAESLQGKTGAQHAREMTSTLLQTYADQLNAAREKNGLKAGAFDEAKYTSFLTGLFGADSGIGQLYLSQAKAAVARGETPVNIEASRLLAAQGVSAGIEFLGSHPVGRTFRVDINGESYNAIITNVRNTHKERGNPFSLSKIQVTVAVNGALRSLTVPATQFNKIEVSSIAPTFRVEQLFKEQPPNQRETAKVVTGNLLAAYGELSGVRGTIINFTKQDGTTEQGILLPKAFDYSKNTRGDYRLESGAAALKFLQESQDENIGRFGIMSRDSAVRVLPAGRGVRLQVPKSKLKGGKYFLDQGLIDIAGDFVSSGQFMVATVYEPAAAVKLLDALSKKQALYALPSMAEEAKVLVGKPGGVAFSRTKSGAQSANDQSAANPRRWYDRLVSLLPDAYRGDSHRREPLPSKARDAHASAELQDKIETLNKQLRGENDRKGYGPVSADDLGNLQFESADVSTEDIVGPIKALADELGYGVAATGVSRAQAQALIDAGFTPEIGLGAAADRLTGRIPVMPNNAYAVSRPGSIFSYKPRGFPMVLFSRNQPISRADSNAQNVATQMLVDGLTAKWTRAPEIIVARNMQDPQIPQEVRDYDAELKSQGSDGEARGFIYKGKVYLLSDQLQGPAQIAETLFHEVLGHFGLRGAFGEALNPILQQIGTMRRADVLAKAREYGMVKKGMSDADTWAAMSAKDRLSAAEEVLAEMAQTQPTIGFVTRAVAAVRNWLRANVPGFDKLALTDADIIQAYLIPARGFVTRSNETMEQSIDRAMMAFSRNVGDAPAAEARRVQEAIEGKGLLDAARFLTRSSDKARAAVAQKVLEKLERLEQAGVKLDLHIVHRGDMAPAAMANARGYTETGFDDKGRDIAVWLNGADVVGKVGVEEEVLLHELVHATTTGMVFYGRNNPRSIAGKHVRDLMAVTDAISGHITQRFADADAGKSTLTEFEKDMRAGANNAFRSDDEVLAWALSNAEAQQYLETIPYKSGSLWSNFVQSVRSLLGLSPASDTTLTEVLRVADRLMTEDAPDAGRAAFWQKRGMRMVQQQGAGSIVQRGERSPKEGLAFSRTPAATSTSAWDAPLPSSFDDIVYKMQDKNIDTKRVVDAITEKVGQIKDAVNVYLQEELFHGRAAKRVQDFGAMELKPALNQMRMLGISLEDMEEFLHARHAKEANALIADREPGMPDGGSGMTDKAADAYMAGLPADRRRKLDIAAAKIDAIIAKTRQMYAEYGLENQQTVDDWGDMFQSYVPLMREGKDGGMGIGQGFTVKGKEVKGRTGSTRKVVDILANIAAQREKVIVRGEKNRVAAALVGLAAANPNADFWEARSQPPTERVYDAKSNSVVDRPDSMFKQRANVVTAKVKDAKGNVTEQAVVFNEDDPRAMRMASSLKNLDAGQLEGLLGVSAKITRYFAAVNTQYNPVFGAVNLVRDVQGAMVNLQSTPLAGQQVKIAKNTMGALAAIYQDLRATRQGKQRSSKWSALWDQMQEDGGTTGYRDLFTTSADRANSLRGIIDPNAWAEGKWGQVFTANGTLKVPMGIAKQKASALFDWLSDYNEAMENGVRLAAYSAALDQGLSRAQAASLSKNLTVNFNRKGQIGQQAGALYAFFNAAMQGTARIGQALFEMDGGNYRTIRLSKTGKRVVAGGIALGSIQAMMLAAAGFGDDDPPEFLRERSLIIPTGGKSYVTIPMPLGLHVIPGIGRHATEFALSGFKDPAKRAISVIGMFADAFNPIGNAGLSIQTIAPTVIDPLVALTENKDWTGKPIARTSSNRAVPGHSQWKDTASTPAKWIAEAINFASGGDKYVAGALSPTPDQIDYLFAQVTGGVGREVAKVEQTVMSTVRGEELPTYKVPLVGRFYGSANSQASEGTAFYASLNKLNEIETKVKAMRKDGKWNEAAVFMRSQPDAPLIQRANAAERQVQKLKRDKRALIEDGATREQVKAKEAQITAVMAGMNRAVEARQASAKQ